jgi:hypothetical protein
MRKQYSINLAFFVTIPLTVWLAATGRISWAVFVAVWVPHLTVTSTFSKRG